ncbi:uncharacterized protein BO96DRAFT_461252 [Aspergillus niger CBS 101883]|uniref:Uncharacterized protein n=3 Tax=Aspergillus niger TaxID=5061 RepID=A2QSU8_ASPNC|nr:uncharacterized protein BO96DRAFT_461252 [Aspergillus niger CBS 101883]XP_059601262.1 hypothetical protein An08g12000 [Aspergillus niger]PYH61753.1 hypothetical protein BO96DRAFT_461252 [Aspergillus niger CBS 101883]RDH14190.1 hypothetical protein M747DRAFT_290936 [Aspergillus niger ATCC 13496]CAK40076.1 hypothetical protein An08g12000 [Aspergillus niger]
MSDSRIRSLMELPAAQPTTKSIFSVSTTIQKRGDWGTIVLTVTAIGAPSLQAQGEAKIKRAAGCAGGSNPQSVQGKSCNGKHFPVGSGVFTILEQDGLSALRYQEK